MDHIIPSNTATLLCRLCLCEDVYMFPIFNETHIYLPQRIAACVNIEVYKTDSISTLICKQCLNKINDWHEFKRNCDDSQSKLRYWSNSLSNDPIFYISNHIKEEIISYNDEETLTPEYVEVIKSEPIDICYDDFSINNEFPIDEELSSNEENDPVSTTMYFSHDENPEINQEPETLLVPTHEVPPDAHGLNEPLKQPSTNGIEDIKIKQVCRVLPCRICGKIFYQLPNRSRHERAEHMINFKEIKCFTCEQTWKEEDELLNHYKLYHSVNSKISYTSVRFDKSHEYLKELTENLVLLRNHYSSAKQISLKSFMYYNQCIQKMVDRNSIDSNTSLKQILDQLFAQNLIINNTCHQCCISFKSLTDFKQHISKRYCKKRMRLVESGQIQLNQHFKCGKCDRIFGCKMLLMHHIRVDHALVDVPEKCDVCMKPFQSKHEYNSHIQETCSYQIYCSICDLLFRSTDDFKLHSRIHDEITDEEKSQIINKKGRKFWKNKCCLCTKFYRYYQDLRKHFKNIHPEFTLITCEHCGDNFISELERKTHIGNVHYKNNTECLNLCIECNIVFNTNEDLEEHKITHNNTGDCDSQLFTCCEQSFNFEEELKKHIQTDHIDTKPTKPTLRPLRCHCTICKKSFISKRALLIHDFRMHQNKRNQALSCVKCHQKFCNEKSLSGHVRKNRCIRKVTIKKEITSPANTSPTKKITTSPAKKDTTSPTKKDKTIANTLPTCILCRKKFYSKKSLHLHARIHYQNYKLNSPICLLCGKRFTKTRDLLNHFKSHSTKSLTNKYNIKQVTKTESYKCKLCLNVYASQNSLNRHNEQKHRNQIKKEFVKSQIIKATRPPCVVCKQRLGLKTDLVNHMREHVAKDDAFKCTTCNKSFVYGEYLSHMSTVHKKYDCILCNKKYTSFESLNTHRGWHLR